MKNSAETLESRNRLRKYWRETIDPESFPHEIERLCVDCGQRRMCRWTSSFSQTGAPEYRARCNPCHLARANRARQANRPTMTSRALDRKNAVKVKCVEYLGGSCVACGYNRCVKALTFHHRDPSVKSFEVSQMLDRAWLILRAELDKCELLCFNCHMERHCLLDQHARVVAGAPKSRGCDPHPTKES